MVALQADIWDVDGTGMQIVPDVQAARKMRKVFHLIQDSFINSD
jgi:hypothetical protein